MIWASLMKNRLAHSLMAFLLLYQWFARHGEKNQVASRVGSLGINSRFHMPCEWDAFGRDVFFE